MEDLKLVATAREIPAKVVTNDDLSRIMETSDEWIKSRTGIEQRHLSETQNTSDLAISVGRKLLAQSGWSAASLDLIVVATMSPDAYTPATAATVQGALGATNAVAFDLSAACSGFVYAWQVVNAMAKGSQLKRIMVIGSEVLSKLIDWTDRRTAVLFGDGAAGVLLEKQSTTAPFMLGQHWATFGGAVEQLNAGLTAPQPMGGPVTSIKPFAMDGRAVYKFATHEVPTSITAAAMEAGITVDQIDHFLLHQANARIIKQVAKRLDQPMDKFPININRYGNTSAASEPILLDELVQAGELQPGEIVALSGFGGGLTVGTIIIKL
ncbi:beta-ketoacyl-ACP synthase III [Limosilactobacillus equigenerosi]|uniref:Beta-ketoacyl-[acyl-carrier-protein] synthase III n=2 Tax=Limosilactobacillus TaxID=2742598 RepID=A0A0R1UQ42_9LACO|nr:beta-ketoacyl-ACP synthase III [Limosilactobacillus equigenerosi]KRL94948.1 Beta-ketoacyl-acyl-carrier-protein synthase I [Limosilactobacillus equigenerosi DSM 18793 = JCM 14505]